MDRFIFITDREAREFTNIDEAEKFKSKCENNGMSLINSFQNELGAFFFIYHFVW